MALISTLIAQIVNRKSQMAAPAKDKGSLTESQREAVASRGNVLVMAGAGAGKTHTLVERCLNLIRGEQVSLEEILVVTFTEAAAAEMRQRLRAALEKTSNLQPATSNHLSEQLALFDAAHIGTLHGFCFKLVREHFYELGLDPQSAILDEGEARLLADETLDEIFQSLYAGSGEFSLAVQNLVQIYGGGRDEKIRSLILRLHHYAQTRPDAEGWLARQTASFSAAEPEQWRAWLLEAIQSWRDEWLPVLESLKTENEKAVELADVLSRLPKTFPRETGGEILKQIIFADGHWPARRKTALRKPLEDFFDEAAFLLSLAAVKNGTDPLAEDWTWSRGHMAALLRLAREFEAGFSERKRADGVLDFHDLEQFALKLLWDFGADQPTPVALRWREKLRFVFVDEYQDINAAQDKIIEALSRENAAANRFLVGDVKQSIYRFRLADPAIFRDYAKHWRGGDGTTIPLSENFRSRESLLDFVNSVFRLLMREEAGGVNYDAGAELKFGTPESRPELSVAADAAPRAELLLRLKQNRGESPPDDGDGLADLEESEKEARLLALRLAGLKNSGHEIRDAAEKNFRPVDWRDMTVLLRSPAGKSEIFAKQFERAGVPLAVARGGFYDSSEILDLLSLLQLLDNPFQDVPCIAVLRSPLVGCSLDELAEIRLAAKDVHFWTALLKMERGRPAREFAHHADEPFALLLHNKISQFLERFSRWRQLARQAPLSQCLEEILAETLYADWLRAQPRGTQRSANVVQFLHLAQQFDQFQRQGLFRFLKFIEAQREAGVEPEFAPAVEENAVRLMSIHQSKGQEFPVVAIADLAKPFNIQDLREDIILDEEYGLCPRIKPPDRGGRYPSLTHWLAQRRHRRELLGEELRLLYVAMTRARDTLILTGGITEIKWETLWTTPSGITTQKIAEAKSFADWLGLWFGTRSADCGMRTEMQSALPELRWRIVNDAALAENSELRTPNSEIKQPVLDEMTARKLRETLEWQYSFSGATRCNAKSSVTALRREAEGLDDEAERVFEPKFSRKRLARTLAQPKTKLPAAEIGAAHHKFLQHLALEKAGDGAALNEEAERLEQKKILSPDERSALDLEALANFWNSDAGAEIREHSAYVKRELLFTAKFSPAELAGILGKAPEAGVENEFVVVQGVADLAVLLPEQIWLVDFKTDAVRVAELPEKTKIYSPQLKLYAAALEKIYSRPVTKSRLHFLAARKTVVIP